MAATTSPKTLSQLTRLALTKPEFKAHLLPLIRQQASTILSPKAKLRVELRRHAATTTDPVLAKRIVQALEDREARFEEGKSVDVEKWLRDRGNEEAADDWKKFNEEHRDKFKE